MPKKSPTAADKRRWSKLLDMGCILCGSPEVHIHHLTGAGMGMKSPHQETIPLCADHHVGPAGIHQIGRRTWEATYGRQEDLLEKVNRRLKDE